MKKTSRDLIGRIVDSGCIRMGSCIILGLSGGPDSLCLLHALNELSDSLEIVLFPVHINHKLRPEADDEMTRVIEICDRMDLECLAYEVDCKNFAEELKASTEEAGRIVRYQIFDDVADGLVAKGIPKGKIYIATAHNSDDQSETVLFRLMRGTGLSGLSGISSARASEKGYTIIRPLLRVSRKLIEGYIEENKLVPNIDKSNEDTDYTRNRIRQELIPYLEKNFNPSIKDALVRFSEIAEQDDAVLEDISYAEFEKCASVDFDNSCGEINLEYLMKLPLAIIRRIVGIMLSALSLSEVTSYQTIQSIIGLAYSENPSARISLPTGYVARREYAKLIIELAEIDEDGDGVPDNLIMMPQIMMLKEFEHQKDEVYAAFDFDAFNKVYPGKVGEIRLRTRQSGDYIAIKDGKSKKLQDFFVDAKIPAVERDRILVAAIGSEILWVLPSEHMNSDRLRKFGKFSQNYQITEATSRVLFLELNNTLC